MKALLFFLLLWPLALFAHIGSPNVYFEGHAGTHAARVSIRPPTALPGMAQVDVRVEGSEAVTVSVQAIFRGAEAPAPTAATAVVGDPHLFSASVWLLRRGAHVIRITIEDRDEGVGPRKARKSTKAGTSGDGTFRESGSDVEGGGVLSVPLEAAALARPAMPLALGGTLIGLGVLLAAGAVWIAVVATPARPRMAGSLAALGVVVGLAVGWGRWDAMDREFRDHALARPKAVRADVLEVNSRRFLRVMPEPPNAQAWTGLAADHGKLLHLFLVQASKQDVFAHLHPVRRDSGTFESVLPALPAGAYQLYGEITRLNGSTETLVGEVVLPPPGEAPPQAGWTMLNDVWCQSPRSIPADEGQPAQLDADDSWHLGAPSNPATGNRTQTSRLSEGGTMVFLNAGDQRADRETSLRFAVFKASGETAVTQPYMAMNGHCAIRRDDGSVFTHLHPLGTISMAAQQILGEPGGVVREEAGPINEVSFPYAFPKPGEYRVWTQVRVKGRVETGVFEVRVGP